MEKATPEQINQSASGMIRIYKETAAAHARVQVQRMADRKDADGEENWKAIVQAIEEALGQE